jgi:hypothetical protein
MVFVVIFPDFMLTACGHQDREMNMSGDKQ